MQIPRTAMEGVNIGVCQRTELLEQDYSALIQSALCYVFEAYFIQEA